MAVITGAEVNDGRVVVSVSDLGHKVSFLVGEIRDRVRGLRYRGDNPILLEKYLKGCKYLLDDNEADKMAKKIEITLEMDLETGFMRVKREVENALLLFMKENEVAGRILAPPGNWKVMDMKAKKIDLPVTSEAMKIRTTDFPAWQAFEGDLNTALQTVKEIDEISDIKCDWIKNK